MHFYRRPTRSPTSPTRSSRHRYPLPPSSRGKRFICVRHDVIEQKLVNTSSIAMRKKERQRAFAVMRNYYLLVICVQLQLLLLLIRSTAFLDFDRNRDSVALAVRAVQFKIWKLVRS